jgi:hypothetical protein
MAHLPAEMEGGAGAGARLKITCDSVIPLTAPAPRL